MMKKFLMALAATTMVASPILATQAQAQPNRQQVVKTTVKHKANGRTVVKQKQVVRKFDSRGYNSGYNRGYHNHRWAKGQRFDRRQASNYRVINDYRNYRLNTPPRGYQWVRSGNDAVMIALTSGIIGAVIGNAIR
ncbi:MAG: RcnB family protein [Pseudomonadota bacterium]